MRVTVRLITRDDADIVAGIHIASWRDAYRGLLREEYLNSDVVADRTEFWTGRLRDPEPSQFGFIAEAGDRPVGFVFLRGATDRIWGTLLDNLHVLPEHRGGGIGRLLVEAAARETLRRHPNHGVYLWVFESNVQARRLYARLGGREVEVVVKEPPGGGAAPSCRVAWSSPAELLRGVA